MKIALCKSHLAGPVSGADETLVAYAIASHQAKHNIEVVLIHRCAEHDQYYVRLKNAGVPVSFVVARSPFYSVLLRIRNLLASVLFFIFLIPGSMDFLRRLWQAIITFTTQFHLKLFSPKLLCR